MTKKRSGQNQFHRSQIGRAQSLIRSRFGEQLTLLNIAREAGSSSYHFARLFLAYTGETPFEFLRRVRLLSALRMLLDNPDEPVTDIALNVGYETSSAFNKAFKKLLNRSPGNFRKLGQEQQKQVIYDLTKPRVRKEIIVNLAPVFEIVTRPLTHYLYLERKGPFAEVAPPAWNDLFPLLHGKVSETSITAYLGLSGIDTTGIGEEAMIYEAGVALSSAPETRIHCLQYRMIESGTYARFLLTGPYSHIWIAFDQMFKTLAESKVELRKEFCIENYLNDPKITPEDQLLTELLIPTA